MIFEIFAKLVLRRNRKVESVTDYSDAISWIKTYRKARNYDTAIMACRELLLKIRSAVGYLENAEKKVIVLEGSNIPEIAASAKVKRKELEMRMKHYHLWDRIIHNLLHDCENEKAIFDEKKAAKEEREKFDSLSKEIETLVHEKQYVKALQQARTLLSVFDGNPKAVKIYDKIQKLNEKQKTKEEKKAETESRLQKFFEEVGMEMKPAQSVDVTEKLSTWQKFRMSLKKLIDPEKQKDEYVKNQKTLKMVESLLIKAGWIHNLKEGDPALFDELKMGTYRSVSGFSLAGFDFFGRIMGKDRIVGDTFGSYKDGKRTVFYFGDATGHGIQAGFTVAELSKIFHEHVRKTKSFPDFFVKVNNELKERLKGRVFVTAFMFEHDAETNVLRYIGAGHDPIFVYRHSLKGCERIKSGGLPLGVRFITNTASVKIIEIDMNHKDMIFGFTDGFVECRDGSGALFGLDRLQDSFKNAATAVNSDPEKAYNFVLKEVSGFTRGFDDDVSAFVFTRNTDRDIVANKEDLQAILDEVGLSERENKFWTFKNHNRAEVVEMLKKEKYERELRIRMMHLDRLFKMGEYLKLRMKIQENYRDGFVHERMKKYLEKVILNEDKNKLVRQEDRLKRKYETLAELQKKGENELVIREVIEIITRNGRI